MSPMDSIGLWWTLVGLHWTPEEKSTGFYHQSTELEQKLWKNCPIGLKMLAYSCANKSPIGVHWIPVESSGVQWSPIGQGGGG